MNKFQSNEYFVIVVVVILVVIRRDGGEWEWKVIFYFGKNFYSNSQILEYSYLTGMT